MAKHPAGTVVVLRSRPPKPGQRRQMLCRLYSRFVCAWCGKKFTASTVHEYDSRRTDTAGVGRRITPDKQMPVWCPLPMPCRAHARRSPLLIRVCADGTCGKQFKTHNPIKFFHKPECRKREALRRRQANREEGSLPSFAFELTPAQIEALGIDDDENDLPHDPEAESPEERERQHLRALARDGDEEARDRLRG